MSQQRYYKMTQDNCQELYLFLCDQSETKQARNKELRRLSPINNAIFHLWLRTHVPDVVQFIINCIQ